MHRTSECDVNGRVSLYTIYEWSMSEDPGSFRGSSLISDARLSRD